MLAKIAGCIYIIMATSLLFKAEAAKEWFTKNRDNKSLFLIPLVFGLVMIYIGRQYYGILANIVIILGCLGLLKGIIFLIPPIASTMMEWALSWPITWYRLGACVHMGIGIILLMLE